MLRIAGDGWGGGWEEEWKPHYSCFPPLIALIEPGGDRVWVTTVVLPRLGEALSSEEIDDLIRKQRGAC